MSRLIVRMNMVGVEFFDFVRAHVRTSIFALEKDSA